MDRAKFDQFILQKAIDNGAKLKTNHKFIGYKEKDGKLLVKTKRQ